MSRSIIERMDLYIPQKYRGLVERLRQVAEAEGTSSSRWICDLVVARLKRKGLWPKEAKK